MKTEERICKIHGLSMYRKYIEDKNGRSCYRCLQCRSDSRRKRYQDLKKQSIKYLGGSCLDCGYNKCDAALEFHHLDPKEKDIDPNKVLQRSWINIKNELDNAFFCVRIAIENDITI